jgi:hypothetical protein
MTKRFTEVDTETIESRVILEFINEVNELGLTRDICAECRSYFQNLYELSNAIVLDCDLSEIVRDPKYINDDVYNMYVVHVARCLVDPTYLGSLGSWCPETHELVPGPGTDSHFFLRDIIGNYYDLLTPTDKRYFGYAILFIKNLDISRSCIPNPIEIRHRHMQSN